MKKNKINLLPIIGIMVAVATFAFTTIEKNAAPEDGWYEVTQINHQLPDPDVSANLMIGQKISDPPERDEEACAEKDNDGYRCAVELLFDKDATEVPETVEQAEVAPLVTIKADARQPE